MYTQEETLSRQQQRDAVASETLRQLCDEVGSLTDRSVGGRVWILPARFTVAMKRGHTIWLSYAQLGAQILGRPRMALAACQLGPVPVRSNINWAVGKGLPGHLTFDEELFSVIQHDRDWPDVNVLSKRQWADEPPELTLGRSLPEAQKLKMLYGTVVGVPVIHPASQARLGCITLHTQQGQSLTDDEACEAALMMVSRIPELANRLVDCLGLAGRL